MNRKSPGDVLMGVVLPVFIYFAATQIMNIILQFLPVDAVQRQAADAAAGLAALAIYKKKRGDASPAVGGIYGGLFAGIACSAVMLGCAGIAMNNVIAVMGLAGRSDTYQAVERAFYSSSLVWEIIGLGIISPVAEELLYRDIVFSRLREWGRAAAILGSAAIFALLHMNIVQGIYAFVLGILLGILMEHYRDVRIPMCGHISANIISILRGETRFLDWLQPGSPLFWPVTAGLAALSLLLAARLAGRRDADA